MQKKIIVIGGGAGGMLFAALAARPGTQVTIVEKNEKLGKKLFITGKGRCNFTNRCDSGEFLKHVVSNSRFLYSAVSRFSPEDLIALFESWGLRTKTERGRRMFPASDKSSDVIDVLKSALRKNGVKVMLHTKALDIITSEDSVTGIRAMKDGEEFFLPADRIVVASGGLSYPSTGSDGDGYRFAEKTGHRITKLYPSLVPIVCREESVRRMQGLSLKNVELVICSGKKILFSEFGEMMFTHFGITGPLVLSASACIGPMIGVKDLRAWINLKPAISETQFDQRLLRLFEENPNKELKNILGSLYPSKLQDEIPLAAGIDPEKKIHDITREERASLVDVTMHFPLTFTALRGYNEAVVTKGGISVKDVNPKTMESKVIRNLFFVGEVLDLDAFTGGYNLQIAWSTAACAAEAASVWE